MTNIKIQGISKTFGKAVALRETHLSVNKGEIFFLVGPSGCGKTTLLRILAGLERPDAGRVLFDDKDVTNIEPGKRNLGFVFQSYALWPHMSVRENIEFGLIANKTPEKDRKFRMSQMVTLLNLEDLLDRYPHEISGGQQQRVAIARSLVMNPPMVLMDEPLSNLDFKLKESIRGELKRLQNELGFTLVYVSHDFDEALALADRVAVMSKGRIVAIGRPLDLYFRPPDLESAKIVGPVEKIPTSITGDHGVHAKYCRQESIEVSFQAEGCFVVKDISYKEGRCFGRLDKVDGEHGEEFYAPLDDQRVRSVGTRVSVNVKQSEIFYF